LQYCNAEKLPFPYLLGVLACSVLSVLLERTEQNRTEQNRTEQNRTEQNRTEQNRTEQNRTEQNRTEQNRTEQNRKLDIKGSNVENCYLLFSLNNVT
jgi:type II secretory pathway pseudopilin PulG